MNILWIYHYGVVSLVRDHGNLVRVIKRIVKETIENDKPTRVMYGQVVSTNPLKVSVEQRMVLDKNFLVLSDRLTRKSTTITVRDNYRNSANELVHTEREIDVVFDNSLKTNDKIILLREQGGQKFIILDKVVNI